MEPPPPPPLLLLLLWATALGGAQELVADNVTVLEGDAAELTCHLHGYDGSIVVIQNPARQTLFFNGTRALKDERFQLLEFSRRRLRVRLSPARLEDEGGYSCQLYGEDTRHQNATLTVLVPPAEPEVTQGGVAVAGAELELRCLVPRARPPAALRWYRDRRELSGVPSREQRGLVFTQLNVLRLRVERGDNGAVVTCEVTHPALPRGQRRRTQHTLDVQYPPSVRIQASPRVLREGDTLVLSCSVTGNPPPTEVSWSRSNGSLPVPGRAEQRAGPWGAELRVPALGPGDNGDSYSCSAGNAHGRASASFALRVYAAGAVLATPQATPFAIVGGVLALLVFLLLCLLGALLWCSVRQKGSYLTHEASGLDEPGEAREAFLGGDGGKRREEFFI
ncbi:cell adhesion molecule 4 isoform X1 [Patagioenas fasciata]|uniref:cell adhesion molecule 4 isoform X1 n=1 Tax=Patagioenas fasciata TaxID=372321 RepID=UPI003A996B68